MSDTGKHPKASIYDDAGFMSCLVWCGMMGVVIVLFIVAFM